MTNDTVAEQRQHVGEHSDEDTHVALCYCGSHLRVARQIHAECDRCHQSIPTGNVGPATWDDSQGPGNPPLCGHGTWNHQHGCGEWNTPLEVTVDPEGYESLEAAVEAALAELDTMAADLHDSEAELVRTRLLRGLAQDVARRESGTPYSAIRTSAEDGTEPGTFAEGEWQDDETDEWLAPEGSRLIAWDFDPRDPGEIIEVGEADLDR